MASGQVYLVAKHASLVHAIPDTRAVVVSSLFHAVVKRAAPVHAALGTRPVVVRRRAEDSVALVDVVWDTAATQEGTAAAMRASAPVRARAYC
jgi:hypothetical protein